MLLHFGPQELTNTAWALSQMHRSGVPFTTDVQASGQAGRYTAVARSTGALGAAQCLRLLARLLLGCKALHGQLLPPRQGTDVAFLATCLFTAPGTAAPHH